MGSFNEAVRAMPTYTFKCEQCDRTMTLQRPIAERDDPGVNCICGGIISRVPDAPDFKVQGGTPRFHK